VLQSHFGLLVIFSACVSTVFAALMREDTISQLKLAARMFAGLLGAAAIIGWLMYPFPL
jgi:heme A synthase